MSTETKGASSGTSGDGSQTWTQNIEDFLLEEKDVDFRQKSLKDYADAVEGIDKEKDRLSRENENLKVQIEHETKATQAAAQLHKTQLETADIIKKKDARA